MRDMNATRWVHAGHQGVTSFLCNSAGMGKMFFDFSLLFDFSSSMLQVPFFFYKGMKASPGYILASDHFLFKCIYIVAGAIKIVSKQPYS